MSGATRLVPHAGFVAAILLGQSTIAALPSNQLSDVGVRPPPDASLPLDAQLSDLNGRPTTLAEAIADRPAVAVFADYECSQLCSPILALTAKALGESGLSPGADYRLIVIGFNPRATAADANRMIAGQIGWSSAVGRATMALAASEPVAARLTSAVGYHYAYDCELGRYAHPAALFVVTARGRLARALSGLAITGDDARLALIEAGKGAVGTIGDQIRIICYGFSAATGFYADRVRIALVTSAAATLFALAAGLLVARVAQNWG